MSEADFVARLKVTEVSKTFGEQRTLSDLTFQLEGGDLLALVGPRGSGKTSLLRLLATVVSPCQGSIELNGVSSKQRKEYRQSIGYMPDMLGQYQEFTVEQCLEYFARSYLVDPKVRPTAIQSALRDAGLQQVKSHRLAQLSSAQERQLALARLLMHEPSLLLLDEPLAGLDQDALNRWQERLGSLQETGKILIVSSQEIDEVAKMANKIALLDEGRLLLLGPSQEVLSILDQSPVHHPTTGVGEVD